MPRKGSNRLIFRTFAEEIETEEKSRPVKKSVSLSSHVKNRQFLDMRDGKIRRSSCLYSDQPSKFRCDLYNTGGHFSSVFFSHIGAFGDAFHIWESWKISSLFYLLKTSKIKLNGERS